jgi:hypothetical protein
MVAALEAVVLAVALRLQARRQCALNRSSHVVRLMNYELCRGSSPSRYRAEECTVGKNCTKQDFRMRRKWEKGAELGMNGG